MMPLLNNQEQLAIIIRLINTYKKTCGEDYCKNSAVYQKLLKKAKELGKTITKQENLTNA